MMRNEDMETAKRILQNAGWIPGRLDEERTRAWANRLDSPAGFQMFEAARKALGEFGGVRISSGGSGINIGRVPFRIDPMLADGEEDRFAEAARGLGHKLYPLGDAEGGEWFIAIDEIGRVHALVDQLKPLGSSTEEALLGLAMGYRSPSREAPYRD